MLTEITSKFAPVLDGSNYPSRWSGYVGQEDAVKMLRVAAKSAKLRKEPLDHVLIGHPTPGLGKTALAHLVAQEMGSEVRVVSGQIGRDKARMIFAGMKDRDVLLYDEIHQLMDGGRKAAEWTLQYLQDGDIVGPLGPETQPRVTIIGTTTDPQKLLPAIVSRFPLQPLMREYSVPEAGKIAKVMAKDVLVDMDPLTGKDAEAIARAASMNPRAIKGLLMSLRDLTVTRELTQPAPGRYDIDGLLKFVGITRDGLDAVAREYLAKLYVEFGGTAGAKALEDRLQRAGGLGQVERALMNLGLVAKTRTGRTLTQKGIIRYQELEATA